MNWNVVDAVAGIADGAGAELIGALREPAMDVPSVDSDGVAVQPEPARLSPATSAMNGVQRGLVMANLHLVDITET